MNEFFAVRLDKSSDVPVYKQLGDSLLSLIEDGVIKAGAKLPPIRTMADALKINNVTVISAYKYLENKKVVYSRMGSGTYVSEVQSVLPTPIFRFDSQNTDTTPEGEEKSTVKNSINFANTTVSPSLFPVERFKQMFNTVLDRDMGNAFSYTDVSGYEPLRVSICKYLEGIGIKTTYDRIQIISGAQQGLDIISKVMLKMGDTLFVESPTYYGAVGAFLSRNAQVVEVPLENDGINIEKLEALLKLYRPNFLYVMTYYQTPTCITYSLQKKRQLLELAAKYDTYIIEEDSHSELCFTNEEVVPLKALDYKNRVIYIKSFSKILMPGLRIGFMVLPKKILQKAQSAKYTSDIQTSGFIQRAFDLCLQSGELESHVATLKEIFTKRYNCFLTELKKLEDYFEFQPPNGGLSFWLAIKNEKISSQQLCKKLLIHDVIATPGAVFALDGQDLPFIRLSLADVTCDEIKMGVSEMETVLRNMN